MNALPAYAARLVAGAALVVMSASAALAQGAGDGLTTCERWLADNPGYRACPAPDRPDNAYMFAPLVVSPVEAKEADWVPPQVDVDDGRPLMAELADRVQVLEDEPPVIPVSGVGAVNIRFNNCTNTLYRSVPDLPRNWNNGTWEAAFAYRENPSATRNLAVGTPLAYKGACILASNGISTQSHWDDAWDDLSLGSAQPGNPTMCWKPLHRVRLARGSNHWQIDSVRFGLFQRVDCLDSEYHVIDLGPSCNLRSGGSGCT